MAKSAAAKSAAKKKNRKLKRQIRKTVGALLMVSAIAVAAVPVPDISATPSDFTEKIKVAVTSDHGEITGQDSDAKKNPTDGYFSSVPYAQDIDGENAKVYTSGDGMFQFAYTQISTTERGAVILNFNNTSQSDSITIPNRIEAYRKYSPNVTFEGYCLVSRNDELLGYKVYEQRKNSSGDLLYETVRRIPDMTTGSGNNVEELRDLTLNQLIDNKDGTYSYEYSQKYTKEDGTTGTRTVTCLAQKSVGEVIKPCFYKQKSEWEKLISTDADLYYLTKKADGSDDYGSEIGVNWLPADVDTHWRIDASVAYIGAEHIEETDSGWKVKKDGFRISPTEGVFAGRTDITNLTIEASLMGIADYAFYDCGTLTDVTFQNGSIETIGNGAFAECRQLQNVSIPRNALIKCIGKDAFYGCKSLQSFTVPDGLEALGDCAFEGCEALTTVTLTGSGRPIALRRLGNHLFRGCTALSSVEFPDGYNETLDIDIFEGCISLQYVRLPLADSSTGTSIDFDVIHALDNTNYPNCAKDEEGNPITGTDEEIKKAIWKKFSNTVPDSFYFEGPEHSNIHNTANDYSITFKYPNQELYEKVVYEHDADADKDNPKGESAKTIYQVNNSGDLVKFDVLDRATNTPSKPDVITIPEQIGAFAIKRIGAGSFNSQKLCDYLTTVTIPASVTEIGDNAFRGCHKLETVVFTDATTITTIGAEAFRTQVTGCSHNKYPDSNEYPELSFYGAMLNSNNEDTVPFQYAMNGTSKINNDNTEDIWITCNSDWPTLLQVRYNDGEAQLVGYPRLLNSANSYDETWAKEWVKENYPIKAVGDDVDEETANMVLNVAKSLAGESVSLTPNESAFLSAATNLVIPASVDSVEPGLFSGYTYLYDKADTSQSYPILTKITKMDDGTFEYYCREKQDDGTWSEKWYKAILKDGKYTGLDTNSQLSTDDEIIPDTNIKTILLNGVNEVEPYTFKECTGLKSADVIGSNFLGDYAFEDCTGLETVTLGTNLQDTGKRPFKGCGGPAQINCLEGGQFRYGESILYRTTGGGLEIVECLENRGKASSGTSYNVGPDELSGVASVKPEAFAECDSIASINMATTSVREIPEGCFKEMNLNSIILPDTLKRIEKDAFVDNQSNRFEVNFGKAELAVITPDAFEPASEDGEVYFICIQSPDSVPDVYAKDYEYIISTDKGLSIEYTVTFYNRPDFPYDTNAVLIPEGTQKVKAGASAIPPSSEGLTCNDESLSFIGWTNYENIQKDTEVYAIYGSPDYTVTFVDSFTNEQIGESQKVKRGQNAIPPSEDLIPQHEGYMFQGWNPAPTNITGDTICRAEYIKNDGTLHKVTYCAYDGTVLTTYTVAHEEDAPNIQAPVRDGYTFTGWMPAAYLTKVTEDRTVVATYQQGGGGNAGPNPSGGNGNGNNPNPSGGNGNNGNNNNANSSSSPKNSAAPTATPADGKDVPKYTVTVSGGSGTGSYPAGAVVAINAYAMGVGQVFDKWTSSTAGVGFADATATSTTFTMPAANVAITATYKTGGAGNAATNSSGGSGGGGGSSTGTVNNGSTVEVSKPGISNTNVAGATVTGATDNFVVKVSEDQAATDAATSALQARFGDLSRIKYFPMDISLYDSTGRTKIADTSGISVNLTLPLPDELIQYAGNNKMAAISGGALEDLNARFTTVGGVPCINFTATHFSPYVIYVDTANLTEATIDSTPKTGDPIHPKWFLAIGMACISLVLFFKRDKVVVKTKAA